MSDWSLKSRLILTRLACGTQTQTQTYLFRQDCRKSKVRYLSRLRSCEEGREQDRKLEIPGNINKDRKRWKEK